MNKKQILVTLGIIILLIIFGVFVKMNLGNKSTAPAQGTKVLIKTSEGDITLELYSDKAPITVKNFLSYVDSGFYDGTVFHRVIKNFMIQGGGFTTDGTQKNTNSPIKLESNNGLSNLLGTIAMARTMVPDSATSQFFINTKDNQFLDYGTRDQGYAVFGKVISGLDVVQKIEEKETTTKNGMSDWPVDEILIIKAQRIN